MELIAKIISREIKKDKMVFKSYSIITTKGRFYRCAGLEKEDYEDFDGAVCVVNATRKFMKSIINKNGEPVELPTLVLSGIRNATGEELEQYLVAERERDAQTLTDVE